MNYNEKAAIEALEDELHEIGHYFSDASVAVIEAVIAIAKRAIEVEPEPGDRYPQYYEALDSENAYIRIDLNGEVLVIKKDGAESSLRSPISFSDRKRLTEAEAFARVVKPAESPDDWVEITDPKHIRRSCDQCRTIPVGRWVDCFGSVGHSQEFYENTQIRCRRKDLPKPHEPRYQSDVTCSIAASQRERKNLEQMKTRTVTLRKWIVWDSEGDETIRWDALKPDTWDNVHDTGETETYEVPL